LLEDGLGDTIRVSLTEEPELEMPVAKVLAKRYTPYVNGSIKPSQTAFKNPFEYQLRVTSEVADFGGDFAPRVIADFSNQQLVTIDQFFAIGYRYISATDKWVSLDTAADYVYLGNQDLLTELPAGLKAIINASVWANNRAVENVYPLFNTHEYKSISHRNKDLNFLEIDLNKVEVLPVLDAKTVLVLRSNLQHTMSDYRQFVLSLISQKNQAPVVLANRYSNLEPETFQLFSATDMGGVLIDGLANGLMISNTSTANHYNELSNSTAFGILQAARTRMSKTEYISCPSCGRTLFDLQSTTAMIKKRTDHLKGIKIGIMGCIVNGPGEMADADYGYVGAGINKITLYRGQEVVKKGLKSNEAVEELVQLIKEDGRWVESEKIN